MPTAPPNAHDNTTEAVLLMAFERSAWLFQCSILASIHVHFPPILGFAPKVRLEK